jgi:hypothetical protein
MLLEEFLKIHNEELGAANVVFAETHSADNRQVDGNHYKNMPIQPWTVMEAVLTPEEFRGFLKGNLIKYSLRAGHKGAAEVDAEKAKHYLQKLNEVTTCSTTR